MAEGARLESVCTVTGTVGSNPTLSALKRLAMYGKPFYVKNISDNLIHLFKTVEI